MGNVVGGIIGTALVLLSPIQQNGASLLGLLTAPTYGLFLTNNPLPQGTPWGSQYTASSNVYRNTPNTGVTRTYDFTVTRGTISPDGVAKNVILINGQFPGPTITANWGDMIQVTVRNQIFNPQEGIGFHWHGLLQKATQYYDGVAGVTQCPITPGDTFTYKFQADMYGTSWYHSHYSAQYAGGLIGPMIIFGPTHVSYDVDLGPVLLSDYYHANYSDIVSGLFDQTGDFSRIVPASDNNLINGKNSYDCKNVVGTVCVPNAPISQFRFKSGKVHRLRLINAGAEALQRFSIDGHTMTVIANDFVPVVPYKTKFVTLGIGQRTDVLVTANVGSLTSSFYMRATISAACSVAANLNALASVFYDKANVDVLPTSTPWSIDDSAVGCGNDPLTSTVPFIPVPAVQNPDVVQNLDITYSANASNMFLWHMNGQSFRANYNSPILLLANQGNYNFKPEWNVYNYGTNKSITFVINNPPGMPPHPMHMHGHNMMVLHEGPGAWDGTITNPNNPQRRDVQMLEGGSHIVLQITTDNPGAWPLHCHIAWHVSSGLYITILERPDLVQKINIPANVAQGCRNWGAWTGTNIPDQIDSGL